MCRKHALHSARRWPNGWRAAGRSMSSAGGGSIIVFSSVRSQVVEPGQGVYAATKAGAEIQDGLARPDRVLLNGGVFNAPAMIERLSAVLEDWYGGEPVPLLTHTSLDTAVARGAVRFALGKRGFGHVITGGSARVLHWVLVLANVRRRSRGGVDDRVLRRAARDGRGHEREAGGAGVPLAPRAHGPVPDL